MVLGRSSSPLLLSLCPPQASTFTIQSSSLTSGVEAILSSLSAGQAASESDLVEFGAKATQAFEDDVQKIADIYRGQVQGAVEGLQEQVNLLSELLARHLGTFCQLARWSSLEPAQGQEVTAAMSEQLLSLVAEVRSLVAASLAALRELGQWHEAGVTATTEKLLAAVMQLDLTIDADDDSLITQAVLHQGTFSFHPLDPLQLTAAADLVRKDQLLNSGLEEAVAGLAAHGELLTSCTTAPQLGRLDYTGGEVEAAVEEYLLSAPSSVRAALAQQLGQDCGSESPLLAGKGRRLEEAGTDFRNLDLELRLAGLGDSLGMADSLVSTAMGQLEQLASQLLEDVLRECGQGETTGVSGGGLEEGVAVFEGVMDADWSPCPSAPSLVQTSLSLARGLVREYSQGMEELLQDNSHLPEQLASKLRNRLQLGLEEAKKEVRRQNVPSAVWLLLSL